MPPTKGIYYRKPKGLLTMSSAPFDFMQVVRLLESEVSGFQKIGGAADYALITKLADYRTPSAYVIVPQENARPNPTGNSMPGERSKVKQLVTVTFGVVVAVRNFRYDKGQVATQDANPLIGLVREAIMGWTPSLPLARACQFVSGRVIDYDKDTLLWADIYQTQHSIGKS